MARRPPEPLVAGLAVGLSLVLTAAWVIGLVWLVLRLISLFT
jgi:hypothetical protein